MYKEIVISTTSRQMADELLALNIPDAQQNEIQKFGELEKLVFNIGVTFFSTVSAGVLARWIYDQIIKPGNDETKINGHVPPNNIIHIENMIVNFIQNNPCNKSPNDEVNKD